MPSVAVPAWPERFQVQCNLNYITRPCLKNSVKEWTSKMAQGVKTYKQVWQPKFNPQNPHGGRKAPTPESCLLTATCIHWHMPSPINGNASLKKCIFYNIPCMTITQKRKKKDRCIRTMLLDMARIVLISSLLDILTTTTSMTTSVICAYLTTIRGWYLKYIKSLSLQKQSPCKWSTYISLCRGHMSDRKHCW